MGFWSGFQKRADAGFGDGGSGFTGTGKGVIAVGGEPDQKQGPVSRSSPGGDPTMTEMTLRDGERGPRDFSPFSNGPEFYEPINHVKY